MPAERRIPVRPAGLWVAAADLGWSSRPSGQPWSMTSLWMTVASLASAIAGPLSATAPAAATPRRFQIVLSGIRTTPQRPPRNAFAAGFTGLALARHRCRGR